MDKSIKAEIAVGIVLIIAVMIGGFLWLGKKQQQIQATAVTPETQSALQQVNPVMGDPGEESGPVEPGDLISDRNTTGLVSIESVKMDMPDIWDAKTLQNRMYIKDKSVKSNYDTSLVLSVKTAGSDVTDIKALQDEGAGTDFTEINGGQIFKVPGCGAVACYGAVLKDKIYSFDWDIQTNDPNPQDARNNFNVDAIWNVMKTVAVD